MPPNLKYIMFLICKHRSMEIQPFALIIIGFLLLSYFSMRVGERSLDRESPESKSNGIYWRFELKGQKIIREAITTS